MAQKKPGSTNKTTVRRITADDSEPKSKSKNKTKTIAKKPKVESKKVDKPAKIAKVEEDTDKNPFKAIGKYFRGAWFELKQVRWPTRANTWSMTLAVILFTAMFVVLILLLDAGFKWLFEQILK